MRRILLAAVPFVILAGAACGGDDSDPEGQAPEETPTLSPADAVATADASNQQPQAPDKALPSPTAVPDDSPVVQVVAAGSAYTPTRAEFADLPRVSIDAAGKKYEGVSLATIAETVGARSEAIVTVQGTRGDNLRLGAIRFPLAEIGASTVLVLDESGHLLLASTSVPQEQWLNVVTGISMN